MYKSSKYSTKVNQDLEIRVLDILVHSEEALSTQQIQQKDMILASYTPQKLTRVLGKLIDMGFVKKSKSRANNRMVYKAVSVMLAQGYEIDDDNGNCGTPAAAALEIMPMIPNWEIATERMSV